VDDDVVAVYEQPVVVLLALGPFAAHGLPQPPRLLKVRISVRIRTSADGRERADGRIDGPAGRVRASRTSCANAAWNDCRNHRETNTKKEGQTKQL